MMWPWQRHRQEMAAASVQKATAEKLAAHAEVRRQAVHRQTEQSRSTTDLLKRELELNGWTDLLQTAWGRRA